MVSSFIIPPVDFGGGVCYNSHTHSCSGVVSSLRVYFGRCSRKGLFSCADGEASAADLLGVGLIDFGHNLFKRSGVEALREIKSPTDNVLTYGKLFHFPAQ